VPASAAQVTPAAQVNPVVTPTAPASAEPRTYPLESPSPN
jgi:hypothetical protein